MLSPWEDEERVIKLLDEDYWSCSGLFQTRKGTIVVASKNDDISSLAREIAEAGTITGLSDFEGKEVFITDFTFTKNEQDQRDVIDMTLENGQHVRSGGQLLMTSFGKIKESLETRKMKMSDLLERGYGLSAVFHQHNSQSKRGRAYWTVLLAIKPIAGE